MSELIKNMSVTRTRKSLNSSILKSGASRSDSIKKTKLLRFEVNLENVENVLKDVEANPAAKSYQNLIYKLSEADIRDDLLVKIIKESIESVPLLTRDHILLVQSLLNIRWLKRDTDIIELYHEFIIKLMTSKNDFLVLCLSKVIGCFIPDDDEAELWSTGNPTKDLSEKLQLVHELIKKTFEVMPMVPSTLRKQIRSEFPYYRQPSFKIVAYIENLLRMLSYCPSLICDVLELILENLLLFDVNLPRELIEESEETEDEEETVDINTEKMKLPLAETLDLCMEKILGYLHTKLNEDSGADKEEQKKITEALFQYFNEQILKTYTKHVHFALFYISSFKKSILAEFLNYLWGKIVDRNLPIAIRQTTIGYLSSFLARAKFITIDMMKVYLTKLSDWAHIYVKTCDFNRNKNPKAHVLFYSICQAVFYIIAFRSKDFTRCEKNLAFLLTLDLWPIIKHPLNPLNVCLPAIATIFDNITTKYQILFCHTIIVSNASKSLTTVYANEQHRPEEILESVFPFDPYLLKKSGKRIQPLYVQYQQDEDELDSVRNSPPLSRKRTRYESTSGELEDFIIREKRFKLDSKS